MAELKTKATNQNPKDFLNTIEPEQKRTDGFVLLKMFEKITGEKAVEDSVIQAGEQTILTTSRNQPCAVLTFLLNLAIV